AEAISVRRARLAVALLRFLNGLKDGLGASAQLTIIGEAPGRSLAHRDPSEVERRLALRCLGWVMTYRRGPERPAAVVRPDPDAVGVCAGRGVRTTNGHSASLPRMMQSSCLRAWTGRPVQSRNLC